MAYETYSTEAIVCGSKARSTADRSYLLFTKDAGMIFAEAKSVREEKSKQRYALQEFSIVRVSLFRGKTSWRIASVESQGNLFSDAASREARGSVVRIIKLVRRYVHGEEINERVFTLLKDGLPKLATTTVAHRVTFERLLSLNLLHALGYVSSEKALQASFSDNIAQFDRELSGDEEIALDRALKTAAEVSHL
ncbi:MAG: recombination protein O N-terminal domain-containing protein [Patescibacteria group bacterium]